MTKSISRRKALKNLGAAGAGALLASPIAAGQTTAIQVTGKPVEIALATISAYTMRLTVAPVENGKPQPVPQDGSLVEQRWPAPVARLTTLARERTVRCGSLQVKLSPSPLTIRIEAADGRVVQQLRLDEQTGALMFQTGDKPVLAFGQGGPQFDRRGETYTNRNGQGGYKLRTHGGRAPVQWLIGTGGWAMFIHHPYGAFDLTGPEGKLTPRIPDRPESSVAGALAGSELGALPLDVFIVASREPAQVMAEYARLTGKPELPPLWSFGYLQSHRTLGGPEEIMSVARTFREKKLPCDALIYLGTDFTPSGWNTHTANSPGIRKIFPIRKR